MEIFEKTKDEIYPITFDFTDRLPSGTTISSGLASSRNLMTDAVDNTIFDSTALSITSTTAKGVVKLGNSGDDYEISFTVTLSDSSKLVEKVLMRVRG